MVPTRLFFVPTIENYVYEFSKMPLLKELFNTFIVSVFSTALAMAVSLPAAYSFARFNTGYGHLLFFTLTTRMFPPWWRQSLFSFYLRTRASWTRIWG